jgi:hypothetical protein
MKNKALLIILLAIVAVVVIFVVYFSINAVSKVENPTILIGGQKACPRAQLVRLNQMRGLVVEQKTPL